MLTPEAVMMEYFQADMLPQAAYVARVGKIVTGGWVDEVVPVRPTPADWARAQVLAEAASQQGILDQQADLEAELANERWFENRGYDEARAQEDYEARMGVF